MIRAEKRRQKPKPEIIEVDAANFDALPCCGIKAPTHVGRQEKRRWLQDNAKLGVRAKMLLTNGGEPCGYIESMPGENAWRGVDAAGYLFIQCVWVPSKWQGKGWGSLLLKDCVEDARKFDKRGVATMVREGPWMPDRRLFVANGFQSVDKVPPDCELLVKKLKSRSPDPAFRKGWEDRSGQYGEGLTLLRAAQCPHIAKFVADIAEASEKRYKMKLNVVELRSPRDAQNAPSPYAVFSLVYNGKLLADHPISRTRFCNIMNKVTKRTGC
ncbi:MAG TPA: GNAT family N-acetyltransferase [Dongiaceae bacterium]|nr:GNAT family N-acetyltransferase [Dongiaceae bacterium]